MAENTSRLMGWVSNTQEPKRLNRYELLLEEDLRLACKSVSMPSIAVGQVEIDRMHNKYKVAGSKVTYGDITLIFYDFVDNKAGRLIDSWHKKVYDIGTSLMGFPVKYKRDLTLLMYGPDNSVVESWGLVGCWPKEITRPTLSWADGQGVVEVTLQLSIDEAKLVISGTKQLNYRSN